MSVPSSRQSTIRSVETWAIACISKGIVTSLAPFQKLPQRAKLFRINAGLFEHVQSEQLVRIAKESVDQVAYFRARGILAVYQRQVNVSAFIFHVLQISLLIEAVA